MRVGLSLILLAPLAALPAAAGSHTWSGTTSSAWSVAGNWSAGGAPAMAESNVFLIFPVSPAGYLSDNDVSGLTVDGVTISDNGYAFTGNPLTLVSSINVDAPPPSSISWAIPTTLLATSGVSVGLTGTVFTMSGVLSGTNLSKAGQGRLVLSGANTYTGATTVNQGTLTIKTATALGATGPAGQTIVAPGASLQIQSGGSGLTVNEQVTLNGTGVGGTGALSALDGYNVWAGPIVLNSADASVGTTNPGFISLAGLMSGPGGLTKVGFGNAMISGSGTNTYAGTTTVATGYLGCDRIGTGIANNLVISSAGSMDLSGGCKVSTTNTNVQINSGSLSISGIATETIPSLTMAGGSLILTSTSNILTLGGDVTVNSAVLFTQIGGMGTLQMGTASRTFTVAGGAGLVVSAVIDGTGVGVVKAGPGPALFSGANTFTGATTVNAGTLFVMGTQQFSNATVNSGGTLGGSGTVRNITASPGGTVAPGSSPGILSAGPVVTLGAGSTFAVEIDGTTPGSGYDQLNVAGNVTLAGNLPVTFGFTPTPGNAFTVVQATGTITGTFAGLPEATVFCTGGQALRINYTATTVTLTAVADMTAPVVTPPGAAAVTQTLCQ